MTHDYIRISSCDQTKSRKKAQSYLCTAMVAYHQAPPLPQHQARNMVLYHQARSPHLRAILGQFVCNNTSFPVPPAPTSPASHSCLRHTPKNGNAYLVCRGSRWSLVCHQRPPQHCKHQWPDIAATHTQQHSHVSALNHSVAIAHIYSQQCNKNC